MAERTKTLLAVVGGAAVVAMGGLTAVFNDGTPVTPTVAAPVMPGPMTEGDTVTTTTAMTALQKAKPVVTATFYGQG